MKEKQKFTTKEAAEQEAQYWRNSKVYFEGPYWIMESNEDLINMTLTKEDKDFIERQINSVIGLMYVFFTIILLFTLLLD